MFIYLFIYLLLCVTVDVSGLFSNTVLRDYLIIQATYFIIVLSPLDSLKNLI